MHFCFFYLINCDMPHLFHEAIYCNAAIGRDVNAVDFRLYSSFIPFRLSSTETLVIPNLIF